jgi:TatD DNase family protein
MNWVDSGVNLLDKRFTLEGLLSRASEADVKHLLVISSDIEETEKAIALCQRQNAPKSTQKQPQNTNSSLQNEGFTFACTAGVHPHYADQTTPQSWAKLKTLIADTNVAAIGECGLDFNRNFSSRQNQLYAFEKQLEIAARHNLGVYLHERDAFDEQISLLAQYSDSLKFMVTHCFTGNSDQIRTYVDMGCYVGITGWLCDVKRGEALREAVKHLPLPQLLLETDGPYLFPKTLKPRRSVNEPCNIPFIASALASITGCSIQDIQSHAYSNAINLFFGGQVND